MNDPLPIGRSMLLGAVFAILLTLVPVVVMDVEPLAGVSFEALVAVVGAVAGWLVAKLA